MSSPGHLSHGVSSLASSSQPLVVSLVPSIFVTPDVMPTVHHIGAAYNMAYDVEPYVTTSTKRWFLDAAARNDWLLVLDHEPDTPLVRVRPDDKGWYKLLPETSTLPASGGAPRDAKSKAPAFAGSEGARDGALQ